jgi:hypothetical protein
MKSVYEASSGLDAHMILNLLEQHASRDVSRAEYLRGGIGELSAMGFVRVLVADEDHAAAKQIIGDWETIQPPDEETRPEAGSSIAMRNFISGVFVGALVMYWILKVLAV